MIVAKRFHLLRRCELKGWKYKKVVIFLITFFIYTINFRYLGTSDTVPNVYVAISLINEGNFDLDEFKGKVDLGNVVDYNNKTLSQYPVITPIVAAPFLFLPETLFHVSKNPMRLLYLGKFIATFLISLSTIFIYSSLRKITEEKYALLVTLIYAFGTPTWSTSSQGFWTHTTCEFFLALTIYFFLKGQKDKKYIKYAALPLGLTFLSRPTTLFILVVMVFYVLHKFRRSFANFIFLLIPSLLSLMAYNYMHFDSILSTAYYLNPFDFLIRHGNIIEGFFGQLVSPSRGIFIFSPVLIFSLYGIYKYWKERNILFICFSASILSVVLIYSLHIVWYGGASFGNRYASDVMPLFVLFLPPSFDLMKKKRCMSILFFILLGISIFIQFEGAFIQTGVWDAKFNRGYEDTSWLWSWENNQIIYELLNNKIEIPFNDFISAFI